MDWKQVYSQTSKSSNRFAAAGATSMPVRDWPAVVTWSGKEWPGLYQQHIAQVRIVADARTAAYTALLDAKGECQLGIGDMDIHAQISPNYVKTLEKEIISAPLVVADGNMPQKSLLALMELCHKQKGAFEQIIYKRNII